jgi:hypothetical protein
MSKFYPERFPEVKKDDPRYQTEYEVYSLFQRVLGENWFVFYNVNWVGMRTQSGGMEDGEIDFLLAHPEKGILIVEVKGGGVEYDSKLGKWFTVNRAGEKIEIKNPFEQAKVNKYHIIEKLKETPYLKDRRILIGTCVFFPSLTQISNFLGSSYPSEIVLTMGDENMIPQKLEKILGYWKSDSQNTVVPEMDTMKRLELLFGKSFSFTQSLGSYLSMVKDKIIELTEEQYSLLENLESNSKMKISGGAGTGKTMLAIEKAKRLAEEGIQTLFVCYNANLANHVSSSIGKKPNLFVKSFHSLCKYFDQLALAEMGNGRRIDYDQHDPIFYNEILPKRLLDSLSEVLMRFGAIIVDEGQDFMKNWWVPLELLLSLPEKGIFYIFYDERQKLYDTELHFPFPKQIMSFNLNKNLRNTKAIFEFASKYEKIKTISHKHAMEGEPVERVECKDISFLRNELTRRLQKLIINEKISKDKIAILSVAGIHKDSNLGEAKALSAFALTNELALWGEKIFYDNVRRFKGLEADYVFLVDIDSKSRPISFWEELMYVGITRARAKLVLFG